MKRSHKFFSYYYYYRCWRSS